MQRLCTLIMVSVFVLGFSLPILAETDQSIGKEEELIKKTALDYIEGWYEGSVERMERALHPDLVKRRMIVLPTGHSFMGSVSANSMVEYTRAGGGKMVPKENQKNEITILDVSGNMASAKAVSAEYVDYLHLVKTDGKWVIVNVLWEKKKN